jgi:hypothetical protein
MLSGIYCVTITSIEMAKAKAASMNISSRNLNSAQAKPAESWQRIQFHRQRRRYLFMPLVQFRPRSC